MIVVYVAGPFRASTQWEIAENIRRAERYGLMVAENRAMPLIPHANTAHFHGLMDEQFWLDGTLDLLKRCDGAVFIPGWLRSRGCAREWSACDEHEIPRLNLDAHDSPRPAIARFLSDLLHNG